MNSAVILQTSERYFSCLSFSLVASEVLKRERKPDLNVQLHILIKTRLLRQDRETK